jgi:hypothetical protein
MQPTSYVSLPAKIDVGSHPENDESASTTSVLGLMLKIAPFNGAAPVPALAAKSGH